MCVFVHYVTLMRLTSSVQLMGDGEQSKHRHCPSNCTHCFYLHGFLYIDCPSQVPHKLICLWTVLVLQETTPTAVHWRFIPSKNWRHTSASYAYSFYKQKDMRQAHVYTIGRDFWHATKRYVFPADSALRHVWKLFEDADWLPVWNGPGRDRQDGPQSWDVDSFEDGLACISPITLSHVSFDSGSIFRICYRLLYIKGDKTSFLF